MPTQMPLFPEVGSRVEKPRLHRLTLEFYNWEEFKDYILSLGATRYHIITIESWIDIDNSEWGPWRDIFIENYEDEPELQDLLRDAGFPDSFSVHIY